ncbi:hypothetical protein Pcinc_002845 [Petrolisthes cinctipes]|uniref:RNA-directed DNA polymerase n=1 Tax=Petrolisthes cinctipes TaxID=88211 RepID=A0AAE1L1U6_PETCI|nr:hypothetical protein Pcinc_002845 [Petrolisthes cinctipes]
MRVIMVLVESCHRSKLGKIDQHNYEVQHCPGWIHGNADSLSRRPCEPECKECSKKEEHSKKCNRTAVTGLVSAEEDLWETHDGLVKYWQLVGPKKLRSKILNESHNQITSGHLGVKKTLSRLRQRFYWMGMHQDVEEWCRACDVCCAKKGPKKRGCAPIQLYQVGAPMERVAVDIAGPLPHTDKGNRYICVAMDYFTKWPEAYAIPDHEAATVAQVLVDQFFYCFGMPQELHSDQGRNFESAVFCESCWRQCLALQSSTEEGTVTKAAEPLGRAIYCVGPPVRLNVPDRGGRKSNPRVVHVNRLWQYHGTGQYSWEGSEESCSLADEDVEEDIGVEVQEDGGGLPRKVDQQED